MNYYLISTLGLLVVMLVVSICKGKGMLAGILGGIVYLLLIVSICVRVDNKMERLDLKYVLSNEYIVVFIVVENDKQSTITSSDAYIVKNYKDYGIVKTYKLNAFGMKIDKKYAVYGKIK